MNKEAPEESRIDDPGLLSEKEKKAEEDLPLDEKDFPPEEDLPFLFGAKAAGDNAPAERQVTPLRVTDREPYIFRPSGGEADVGNRERDTLVGGSIVWNQLVDTGDTSVTVPNGHIYAASLSGTFGVGESDGTALTVDGSGGDMVFDLTRMFGAAVADAVYALESATPGAGTAWFTGLFPKPYYAYNAGELLSVNASAHKTVGFNQFDASKLLNYTGITHTAEGYVGACSDMIRALNGILADMIILKDSVYCVAVKSKVASSATPYCLIRYTDGTYASKTYNHTAIQNDVIVSNPQKAISSISFSYGEGTYVDWTIKEININLSWSGYRDGEYEPYVQHTYPLDSDLTLRGVPSWADGKMYYDGDTYEADGTVTRRFGIVDLGTLNWTRVTNYANPFFSGVMPSDAALPKPGGRGAVCQKYVRYIYITTSNWYKSIPDKTFIAQPTLLSSGIRVYIRDDSFTDKDTFTTAMSGVYLVYELAESGTETAEPFTSPQTVDTWGTEEYVVPEQSGVAVPVGHVTVYSAGARAKGRWMAGLWMLLDEEDE